MKNHFPCGHWHKKKLITPPSTDSIICAITPMFSGIDAVSGVGLALYNVTDNKWINGGLYKGYGAPQYAEPNGFHINTDFGVYYADWLVGATSVITMKAIVFTNASAISYDVWTWSDDEPMTYWDRPSIGYRNHVVTSNTGLIACIACIIKDTGVVKNAWAVKVSSTKGILWATHYLPALSDVNVTGANIRIDSNDNIWVSYFDRGAKNFYIYKSINGGTFSLISTTSLGTMTAYSMWYTIDATGQNQYYGIVGYIGGVLYQQLYKSSDSGVSFTQISSFTPITNWSIFHTSNDADFLTMYYPVGAAVFKKSTDSGATFSDITPPFTIRDSYVDHQRRGELDIYTECGQDFSPDVGMQGFLYSVDSGDTFVGKYIPDTADFSDTIFQDGWQPNVDIIKVENTVAGITI